MIEVVDVKVTKDVPGLKRTYLIEIRLVDKSKGTYISYMGLELYNWDKAISVAHNELPRAIKKAVMAVAKLSLDTP